MRARGREQRAGGEAVDLLDREPGVGDRGPRGVDRDRAERRGGVALDLGVRVPDDRDLVGRRDAAGHVDANSKAGTDDAGREVLEGDPTCAPMREWRVDVRRARRPMVRRSACSSSSTSTSTNGRTSSKPGRNDWCITVHDRTTPRPLTGMNAKSGSVLRHAEQTTSGGIANVPHREHRAT